MIGIRKSSKDEWRFRCLVYICTSVRCAIPTYGNGKNGGRAFLGKAEVGLAI